MQKEFECASLEQVALKMTASLDLNEVLTNVTQGLVEQINADFSRIWLLGPGDLCTECYKLSDCIDHTCCLHLKASAGKYISLNGEYRRIPMGACVVGQIAQNKAPVVTSDLLKEEKFSNKDWILENGFSSYAGCPLIFRDELLGVVAMFSRYVLPAEDIDHIVGFANQAAIAVKNARLFSEVSELKDKLQAECTYLQQEVKLEHNFEEIIGNSEKLKQVLHQVEQVSPTHATVLIRGETGTGKELIARAIHNLSPRKDRVFVKVNCSVLPATLIESELFGYEKGAFTSAAARRSGRFELADGGTILLDEIGDMSPDLQAKLLRVLQEGEIERLGSDKSIKIDVRVIAATNQHLEEGIKAGKFREDLYYRLNVVPINLPPLRERKEDIPLLVTYFVEKYCKDFGKEIKTVPTKVLKALKAYAWPGNVRELENVIERAVILSPPTTLYIDEVLTPVIQDPRSKSLRDVERSHILRVLKDCNWVIEGKFGAAEALDLKPGTLRSRMQKLDIRRPTEFG